MMKLLYFDTWRQTPDPLPFPGCITVRVMSACTPGEQSFMRLKVSKTVLINDILKRSKRAVKRAFQYSKAIGALRTMAKVRSNILEYQSRMLDTMAAVSGIVTESQDPSIPIGARIAGFRKGHPLYADILLLHPEQIADVPDGISFEDAATVVYYAFAFNALCRIQNDFPTDVPIIICGDSLSCRILRQLLLDSHRQIDYIAKYKDKPAHIENKTQEGAVAVIGSKDWLKYLRGKTTGNHAYSMGLHADNLRTEEWQELQRNWIGLPPSSLKNLDIFSRIPLELPEYVSSRGLHDALVDMGKRAWSPSSFLIPCDLQMLKRTQRCFWKMLIPSKAAEQHKIR